MLDASILDFSTFGYLGLRHVADELRPWDRFSTGRPSAVDDVDPLADAIGVRMAALQGCEAATFATSTLHVFWDLFGALSDEDVVIYLDEGTYPIAQWGIERAAAHGVPIWTFRHHDANALNSLLSQNAHYQRQTLVVADGFSSRSWAPAPLLDYMSCVELYGGLLVIDDTQAVGVLGHSPGPQAPFGRGGGGSLRWHEIESPNVLLVNSLTKGFGVPIAVLSGSAQMVEWFQAKSQTRVHCSPPSVPGLHAVVHALDVNESHGDELRARLAENVRHFRTILQEAGVSTIGPLFPVQVVPLPQAADPAFVDAELQTRGVRALLQQGEGANESTHVLLVITAAHDLAEIGFAAHVVLETLEEVTRAHTAQIESASTNDGIL